jgi:hypothetical protein
VFEGADLKVGGDLLVRSSDSYDLPTSRAYIRTWVTVDGVKEGEVDIRTALEGFVVVSGTSRPALVSPFTRHRRV